MLTHLKRLVMSWQLEQAHIPIKQWARYQAQPIIVVIAQYHHRTLMDYINLDIINRCHNQNISMGSNFDHMASALDWPKQVSFL